MFDLKNTFNTRIKRSIFLIAVIESEAFALNPTPQLTAWL
jgi:hypothetical protein